MRLCPLKMVHDLNFIPQANFLAPPRKKSANREAKMASWGRGPNRGYFGFWKGGRGTLLGLLGVIVLKIKDNRILKRSNFKGCQKKPRSQKYWRNDTHKRSEVNLFGFKLRWIEWTNLNEGFALFGVGSPRRSRHVVYICSIFGNKTLPKPWPTLR